LAIREHNYGVSLAPNSRAFFSFLELYINVLPPNLYTSYILYSLARSIIDLIH